MSKFRSVRALLLGASLVAVALATAAFGPLDLRVAPVEAQDGGLDDDFQPAPPIVSRLG